MSAARTPRARDIAARKARQRPHRGGHERTRPLPEWMTDRSKLPRRPPGRP
jgi:hypothetical protein